MDTDSTTPDYPNNWTPEQVKAFLLALLATNDQRYEERFLTQEKAVKDALASQEKAVNAAFIASEKAINVAQTTAAEALKSLGVEFRASNMALEKMLQAALQAQKEAVLKAEIASEKRFDSVNEFRMTLSDQQSLLIPRAEATVLFNAINEKLNPIIVRENIGIGQAKGASNGWTLFLGITGLILTLVSVAAIFINLVK